uniref:Uncharacterized protein n=1 Tax=Arundo donax TaxID=35708 RepID=A0A0A9BK27_ARUDO
MPRESGHQILLPVSSDPALSHLCWCIKSFRFSLATGACKVIHSSWWLALSIGSPAGIKNSALLPVHLHTESEHLILVHGSPNR